MVAQRAGAPPPPEMLVSGIVPPLADAYFQRLETGIDLKSGLFPGETVVLVHGGESDAVSVAMGGTGKTQLAVEFTQALRNARAVDVLVWVTASSRDAILAGFARAAGAVGAGDPDADARDAAARFTAWLAHTERRWALVLDDLIDLADLDGLWPAGPNGQIVITTRLPAAAFGVGAHAAAGGLRIAPVGGFSRREALSYLGSRLTDYPDQRIEALDLAEDLDGPADRPGPGGGGDEREPAELPGVPRCSSGSGASTCPGGRSRGYPRRSWPPGRWPPSARTSSCPPGWPGRPWP